jgi:hypothetical protein
MLQVSSLNIFLLIEPVAYNRFHLRPFWVRCRLRKHSVKFRFEKNFAIGSIDGWNV